MIFAYFQITETQYQAYRRTAHLHCHPNLQSHRRAENPLAMLLTGCIKKMENPKLIFDISVNLLLKDVFILKL